MIALKYFAIAIAIITVLSGCSKDKVIICSADTEFFRKDEASAFFKDLDEIKDVQKLRKSIVSIAKNCIIPEKSKPTLIAAIKKFAVMANQEQLIIEYQGLQLAETYLRKELLNASDILRSDEGINAFPSGYKIVMGIESLGKGFSESKIIETSDVSKDGMSFDLQDSESRLIKVSGSEESLVLQLENYEGASAGSSNLNLYQFSDSSKPQDTATKLGEKAGSLEFSSWGRFGESREGFFVVDKKGSVSGIATLSIMEEIPTSKAFNAAILCRKEIRYYKVMSIGVSEPIFKSLPCNEDGSSGIINEKGAEELLTALQEEKSLAGLAPLINYGRNDEADKIIINKLVKSNTGVQYLLFDLVNRFPDGMSGGVFYYGGPDSIYKQPIEEAKAAAEKLYSWSATLKAVMPFLGDRYSSIPRAIETIGQLQKDQSNLPEPWEIQNESKSEKKYAVYSLLVRGQYPNAVTVNGHKYFFAYETILYSGYTTPGEGLRVVVSDQPIFKGQGLETVRAYQEGTVSLTLNQNLGGFTIDAPVLVVMSGEDKKEQEELIQAKKRLAAFPNLVYSAIETSRNALKELDELARSDNPLTK